MEYLSINIEDINFSLVFFSQSSMVASAAYGCPWVDQSRECKIIILIIMVRAQQQFNLNAYGMICVNISKITQVSYAQIKIKIF